MSSSVKVPEEVLAELQEQGADSTHSETLRELLPEPTAETRMEFGERKQIDVADDVAKLLSELSGSRVPRWMVVWFHLQQDD